MSTKKKATKRVPSILGLVLADGQLRVFNVTRTKDRLETVKVTSAPMTLDLLHPEAELVGREIKNHLDAAGIRERHCIVGLPPHWVMSQHAALPELSPEDTSSFLQMEAEKNFPVDPAQLQIARSFQRFTGGTYVTQLAVRREQIDQLSVVLKAAGLKEVSFSLGLAMLPGVISPAGSGGRITIAVEAAGITLLIAAGGGIAAFRTFEAGGESEAGEKLFNASVVARELRITFEQVPAALRSEIRELSLLGDSTMVRQLAETLGDWVKAAQLTIVRSDQPDKNIADEMAEMLASRWLDSTSPDLEFLPPRPGRWAMLLSRYNSKRLTSVGFAAGALVLLTILAFGRLEIRRWLLQSEWDGMQNQVVALETVQSKIREFSPYYDTSFHSLSILKRVTECFPDNGSVTAKSFELHGTSGVSISGTMRDNAALIRVQEALSKSKEIKDIKIEQIRGKPPIMQFTLTIRWNAPSGS